MAPGLPPVQLVLAFVFTMADAEAAVAGADVATAMSSLVTLLSGGEATEKKEMKNSRYNYVVLLSDKPSTPHS